MIEEKSLAMSTRNQETAMPSLFNGIASFEKAIEIAQTLSQSTMVPKQYQGPNGAPNIVVAFELGMRMGLSPFVVMQNLDVIEGRPAWRSQFLIAQVNASGKYRSDMQFEYEERGEKKDIDYIKYWSKGPNGSSPVMDKMTINDRACRAWVVDSNSDRVNGPWVSIEMAVRDGWYSRAGSKWKSLPELMLAYRAAAFFARLHCPETTIGMPAVEEVGEYIDVTPERTQAPQIVEPLPEPAKEAVNDNPSETKKTTRGNGKKKDQEPPVIVEPMTETESIATETQPDHNPETGEVLEATVMGSEVTNDDGPF